MGTSLSMAAMLEKYMLQGFAGVRLLDDRLDILSPHQQAR
jgi:hypothetical protein